MGPSEIETRTKLLQSVDFFQPFSTEELSELLQFGTIKKFTTHEYVIKEDAIDYSFHIILRGKANIIKESLNKRRKLKIAVLEAGECFGEMAMLLDGHRSASVMAAMECFTFVTDGQSLEQMTVTTQLKFVRQVARYMAIKLKKQSTALVEAF
jgi:CRP-like cAMP-binding protein